MIPTPVFLVAIGIALIAGGLIGWDFAIHHHRASRAKLTAHIVQLEENVARFQEEQGHDPQRAWIDIGKRNILNQIEATLRVLRSTLEPDA